MNHETVELVSPFPRNAETPLSAWRHSVEDYSAAVDESQDELARAHHNDQANLLPPQALYLPASSEWLPAQTTTAYATSSKWHRPWLTGLFRNMPVPGLLSLLLAVLSTIASAAVLAVSNGQAVSSWSISPTVWLAVLTVVSNSCLQLALARGLAITWWHRMLQGASLADTHRYWSFGTSLWAAVTAGRHFNALSLATILVTTAMIEGPLLQRASTIATRQVSRSISIQASLAANLPSGYTAYITGEFRTPTTPTTVFSNVMSDYSARAAISTGFEGCLGTCSANIPGIGFQIDCLADDVQSWSLDNYGQNGSEMPQFSTNTTWRYEDDVNQPNEYLTLYASWATNTPPLTYVSRVCDLSLALVSYPISILNGTTTLKLPVGTNPEVLFTLPAAYTPKVPTVADGMTALGGFHLLGHSGGPFFANVSMGINGAHALYALYGLNSFTWSHSVNQDWSVNQYEGYVWRDPVDDILAAYHELMFRLAIQAAVNATLVDPILLNGTTYTSVKNCSADFLFFENYYVSRFGYLGAAIAVVMLGTLSVILTFRGWWKLGRSITLSPLETAKAFGASLLTECHSNDTIEVLVNYVKHKKIRYGAVHFREGWNSTSTLQLAEVEVVNHLSSGTNFDR